MPLRGVAQVSYESKPRIPHRQYPGGRRRKSFSPAGVTVRSSGGPLKTVEITAPACCQFCCAIWTSGKPDGSPNGARFDSPGRSAAEAWVRDEQYRNSPEGAGFPAAGHSSMFPMEVRGCWQHPPRGRRSTSRRWSFGLAGNPAPSGLRSALWGTSPRAVAALGPGLSNLAPLGLSIGERKTH
jgi:hypothetical protein